MFSIKFLYWENIIKMINQGNLTSDNHVIAAYLDNFTERNYDTQIAKLKIASVY